MNLLRDSFSNWKSVGSRSSFIHIKAKQMLLQSATWEVHFPTIITPICKHNCATPMFSHLIQCGSFVYLTDFPHHNQTRMVVRQQQLCAYSLLLLHPATMYLSSSQSMPHLVYDTSKTCEIYWQHFCDFIFSVFSFSLSFALFYWVCFQKQNRFFFLLMLSLFPLVTDGQKWTEIKLNAILFYAFREGKKKQTWNEKCRRKTRT